MPVTGTVRADLRTNPRRELRALNMVPDDARLELVVDSHVDPVAVHLLSPHLDRLHVDVQGEATAVRRWIAALRTGDPLAVV
ncbi:hypothetical protein FE697_015300 [Mumia zhuanghuii]|uniref:Uncharacterized protein n=2 Tax=Mumia TaxID=1546255 RepID=A0ABW1QUE0_9ACTN|nr:MULTISPECIES: hypothetical protein [Mumia]KAA1422498.1 hypothetical protein FE697_015300 [Mumia zhuanghuii]